MSAGGSVLADGGFADASDVVVLLRTSPLPLMVTPGATCALDDVTSGVLLPSFAVVPVEVDGDPAVDADSPPVLVGLDVEDVLEPESGADPVDEFDELAVDVPVVSAGDIP